MAGYSKNVYICFRHSINSFQARSVFDEVNGKDGFEAFMSFEPILSRTDLDEALGELENCAHVLVVITEGMLAPCAKADDPIRALIAAALEQNKNVVPLMIAMSKDQEKNERQSIEETPCAGLFNKNGMTVQAELFRQSMQRLRIIYLTGDVEDHDLPPMVRPEKQTPPEVSVPPVSLEAQRWIDAGTAAGKQEAYQEAVDYYGRALAISPDIALAHYGRGLALQHLGNLREAEWDFDEAIRLKPDYVEAYNNRGLLRGLRNDTFGAIDDYSAIIRIDPNYARAYYNRANQHLKLNKTIQAIDDYSEAIRIKLDFASAYQNRGVVRFQIGDVRGGIGDILRSGCWLQYLIALTMVIVLIVLVIGVIF